MDYVFIITQNKFCVLIIDHEHRRRVLFDLKYET